MKVTAYYTATRTMDIDLPDKYDKIVGAKAEELLDSDNTLDEEMINYIDNYIRQIDPEFYESCGITGKNVDWEW